MIILYLNQENSSELAQGLFILINQFKLTTIPTLNDLERKILIVVDLVSTRNYA